MTVSSCHFDVYGFRFTVRSTAEEALRGIEQDFAFFKSNTPGAINIDLIEEDPPSDGLPLSDAIVYTPRNVTYRTGHLRYIDYHGRALGVQDTSTGTYKLYARDANLLYEATYLYLLSQLGSYLDKRGIHRMHALGITIKERAVLVLLPMGGGKSTLGLELLKRPDVQLLSDDSPFIDRKGNVLAFPLRLGLLPGSENAVPAEHRRVIDRMEFGPKHLVNYSYFKNRVQASAAAGIVFIGARTLAPTCRIEEAGPAAALKACIANCVVGVGLFQGLEFILRTSPFELFKNSVVGASRLRNCVKLLSRSRAVCHIHLGRNSQLNAETLVEYANAHLTRPAENAASASPEHASSF